MNISEQNTYSRWSNLLERACRDLMRKESHGVCYHARGETAKACIQYQYRVKDTLNFENLQAEILLLYSLLPAHYAMSRRHMVKVFKNQTRCRLKAYEKAGHLIHWDDPHGVIEDIRTWFGREDIC